MKRNSLLIIMMLGFGLFSAPVQAFDYSGKFGINGSLGLNTLAMGDVNHTLSKYGGNISSGWEAGLGLSYGLSKSFLLNLGVGEIFNQSSFQGGNISLPALSFQGGGEY